MSVVLDIAAFREDDDAKLAWLEEGFSSTTSWQSSMSSQTTQTSRTVVERPLLARCRGRAQQGNQEHTQEHNEERSGEKLHVHLRASGDSNSRPRSSLFRPQRSSRQQRGSMHVARQPKDSAQVRTQSFGRRSAGSYRPSPRTLSDASTDMGSSSSCSTVFVSIADSTEDDEMDSTDSTSSRFSTISQAFRAARAVQRRQMAQEMELEDIYDQDWSLTSSALEEDSSCDGELGDHECGLSSPQESDQEESASVAQEHFSISVGDEAENDLRSRSSSLEETYLLNWSSVADAHLSTTKEKLPGSSEHQEKKKKADQLRGASARKIPSIGVRARWVKHEIGSSVKQAGCN